MAGTIEILASTFGLDFDDVKDYRYQAGHTKRAIYSFGDNAYYAVGKKAPTDDMGAPWVKINDQLFAELSNTFIWKSETNEGD